MSDDGAVLSYPKDAVFLPGVDEAVPAHYGRPHPEQRVLAAGQAIVDVSHRGVVRVTGPDRLTWLHSLTTQSIAELPAGHSTELLVLSPQGRIEYHARLVDDGEATWLLTEPGAAAGLTEWLTRMQFMLQVSVRDESAEWAQFYVPRGFDVRQGRLRWCTSWPLPGPDTRCYTLEAMAADAHPGGAWHFDEVLVPISDHAGAITEHELAGMWAAEALRVAAWLPRAGVDSDDRSIPHELDWLRTTTHLHKGCYRGQETVARVINLGKPPRRMALLHLDGSGHELPPAGSPVLAGEKTVGVATSVVSHYEDGPIALAVLKRSTALDAPLAVAGVAAAQTPIVVA